MAGENILANYEALSDRDGNGIGVFQHKTSFQTVIALADVAFFDDFLGRTLNTTTTGRWAILDAAGASSSLLADVADGVFQLVLTDTSEIQVQALYWGDQTAINLKSCAVFEARVRFPVLPTTGVHALIGVCTDTAADPDNTIAHAWFRLQATADLLLESDDATTNVDDQDTAANIVVNTWSVFRIVFTDLTSVKFYQDGTRLLPATTFDMSAVTDANAIVQPYIRIGKTAAAVGVGTMDIDYVHVWSKRT